MRRHFVFEKRSIDAGTRWAVCEPKGDGTTLVPNSLPHDVEVLDVIVVVGEQGPGGRDAAAPAPGDHRDGPP